MIIIGLFSWFGGSLLFLWGALQGNTIAMFPGAFMSIFGVLIACSTHTNRIAQKLRKELTEEFEKKFKELENSQDNI